MHLSPDIFVSAFRFPGLFCVSRGVCRYVGSSWEVLLPLALQDEPFSDPPSLACIVRLQYHISVSFPWRCTAHCPFLSFEDSLISSFLIYPFMTRATMFFLFLFKHSSWSPAFFFFLLVKEDVISTSLDTNAISPHRPQRMLVCCLISAWLQYSSRTQSLSEALARSSRHSSLRGGHPSPSPRHDSYFNRETNLCPVVVMETRDRVTFLLERNV